MTDCEGDRDRAIELMEAEFEGQVRSEQLTIYRVKVSAMAFGLAIFAFAIGVLVPGTPAWVHYPILATAAVFVIVPPIQLDRQRNRLRQNLTRRRAARLAIIEAEYRDCIGAAREEE